jgi:transcriptional regulator with XRE-family HTH domain
LALKAEKPKPYPKHPRTVGEHLLKRRHELGLFQKEAAQLMGMDHFTLLTWEKNQATPSVRMLPRIIAFLGYDPHPEPATLGERIASKRRFLGLSRKRTAKRLGVDEATLARWESDRSRPLGRTLQDLLAFLESTPSVVNWDLSSVPR